MGLRNSKGNMYEWITHTWNTVKGQCSHDCDYCYMKRWGKLNPARFDEKELKTNLGTGNFIFVGSSNDLFSNEIPSDWIKKTLKYCSEFENSYLFQTKNPKRLLEFYSLLPKNTVVCTTIETNRYYPEMGKTPPITERFGAMNDLHLLGIKTYATIEPVMDFDLSELLMMFKVSYFQQVNIGADSGGNKLTEPPKDKLLSFISELEKITKVKQKSNLKRLLR